MLVQIGLVSINKGRIKIKENTVNVKKKVSVDKHFSELHLFEIY